MTSRSTTPLDLALALAALLALGTGASMGCSKPAAPVNGIGGYELGKTTLGQVAAGSRCGDKGAFMRCLAPPQAIAGKAAAIELDFAGTEPSATLTEILLDVPGCKRQELVAWLSTRVGEPSGQSGDKTFWEQKHMFLTLVDVPPARCHVIAVLPAATERIQQLEAE